MQKAWNAQGEDGLDFEVLDELERTGDSQEAPDEELRVLAQMWLLRLRQKGINVTALFNVNT